MLSTKISIRFFDDREVRAVWDELNTKWWFSVLDIVALLTDQDDYTKTRNYWKYLKAKLKKENSELVSATTQLKLLASDGKRYLTDMLNYSGIIALGKEFPGKKAKGLATPITAKRMIIEPPTTAYHRRWLSFVT
jgi:cell filamentation protein